MANNEGKGHQRGPPHVHTAMAFVESFRDVPLEEEGVGGLKADKRRHGSLLSHFQGCDSPQELAHLVPAFKVKLTYRARLLADGKAQPAPGEQPEAVVT